MPSFVSAGCFGVERDAKLQKVVEVESRRTLQSKRGLGGRSDQPEVDVLGRASPGHAQLDDYAALADHAVAELSRDAREEPFEHQQTSPKPTSICIATRALPSNPTKRIRTPS